MHYLCVAVFALFIPLIFPPDAEAGQPARGCLTIERGAGTMAFRNHCNVVVNVVYNLSPDRVCRKQSRDYYPCAASISPFARFVIGDHDKEIEWAACAPGYVHQEKPFKREYSCR